MNLEQFGWNPFFANAWKIAETVGTEPGRVIAQHRALWVIAGPFGESYAEPSGRLRQRAEESGLWPTIGDWVIAKPKPGSGMMIHEVLPRYTKITRKMPGKQNKPQVLAANVDTIFLVMDLDSDFNLRRLERFLVQFWNSGAKPVLLLSKADVRDNAKEITEAIRDGLVGVGRPLYQCANRSGTEGTGSLRHRGQDDWKFGSGKINPGKPASLFGTPAHKDGSGKRQPRSAHDNGGNSFFSLQVRW